MGVNNFLQHSFLFSFHFLSSPLCLKQNSYSLFIISYIFTLSSEYYYLLLLLSRTYKYTCCYLYCLTPCVFLSYFIHFATLHSLYNPEPPHFIGTIRLSEKQVFRPVYIFIVKCFLFGLLIRVNNIIVTCYYFFFFFCYFSFSFMMQKYLVIFMTFDLFLWIYDVYLIWDTPNTLNTGLIFDTFDWFL